MYSLFICISNKTCPSLIHNTIIPWTTNFIADVENRFVPFKSIGSVGNAWSEVAARPVPEKGIRLESRGHTGPRFVYVCLCVHLFPLRNSIINFWVVRWRRGTLERCCGTLERCYGRCSRTRRVVTHRQPSAHTNVDLSSPSRRVTTTHCGRVYTREIEKEREREREK